MDVHLIPLMRYYLWPLSGIPRDIHTGYIYIIFSHCTIKYLHSTIYPIPHPFWSYGGRGSHTMCRLPTFPLPLLTFAGALKGAAPGIGNSPTTLKGHLLVQLRRCWWLGPWIDRRTQDSGVGPSQTSRFPPLSLSSEEHSLSCSICYQSNLTWWIWSTPALVSHEWPHLAVPGE